MDPLLCAFDLTGWAIGPLPTFLTVALGGYWIWVLYTRQPVQRPYYKLFGVIALSISSSMFLGLSDSTLGDSSGYGGWVGDRVAVGLTGAGFVTLAFYLLIIAVTASLALATDWFFLPMFVRLREARTIQAEPVVGNIGRYEVRGGFSHDQVQAMGNAALVEKPRKSESDPTIESRDTEPDERSVAVAAVTATEEVIDDLDDLFVDENEPGEEPWYARRRDGGDEESETAPDEASPAPAVAATIDDDASTVDEEIDEEIEAQYEDDLDDLFAEEVIIDDLDDLDVTPDVPPLELADIPATVDVTETPPVEAEVDEAEVDEAEVDLVATSEEVVAVANVDGADEDTSSATASVDGAVDAESTSPPVESEVDTETVAETVDVEADHEVAIRGDAEPLEDDAADEWDFEEPVEPLDLDVDEEWGDDETNDLDLAEAKPEPVVAARKKESPPPASEDDAALPDEDDSGVEDESAIGLAAPPAELVDDEDDLLFDDDVDVSADEAALLEEEDLDDADEAVADDRVDVTIVDDEPSEEVPSPPDAAAVTVAATQGGTFDPAGLSFEELLRVAGDLVVSERRASISFLQRSVGVGYFQAAKLLDRLQKEEVIGTYSGAVDREVLVTDKEWQAKRKSF